MYDQGIAIHVGHIGVIMVPCLCPLKPIFVCLDICLNFNFVIALYYNLHAHQRTKAILSLNLIGHLYI